MSGWKYPVLLLVLAVYKHPQYRFCFISTIKESQHNPSRLVFGLYLCPTTISCHFIPHHPPNVNIRDTTLQIQPAKKFKSYLARTSESIATSAREAFKHSKMVYLFCKFCLRTHNPWLVIVHLHNIYDWIYGYHSKSQIGSCEMVDLKIFKHSSHIKIMLVAILCGWEKSRYVHITLAAAMLISAISLHW